MPRVRLDEDSLEVKAAVLRGARFVVTVDTSVMHLAVGTGVPTLCLASAAQVGDSVPYDSRITPDNVRFLYHDMPCRGCLGSCVHQFEDGMYPCAARLDPDAVHGCARRHASRARPAPEDRLAWTVRVA